MQSLQSQESMGGSCRWGWGGQGGNSSVARQCDRRNKKTEQGRATLYQSFLSKAQIFSEGYKKEAKAEMLLITKEWFCSGPKFHFHFDASSVKNQSLIIHFTTTHIYYLLGIGGTAENIRSPIIFIQLHLCPMLLCVTSRYTA